MRILFLSRWFPYPADNGSRLRVYNLLRGLSQCHEVTLVSFADQTITRPDPPELRALCTSIRILPWKPFRPHSLRAYMGFFTPAPRSVIDTFSPQMARQIRELLSRDRFNLVIASQLETAAYAPYFRSLPALFEEVEVGVPHGRFASAKSLWSRSRHGLTWIKEKHYLGRLLRYFSGCTVVSELERQLLAKAVRDPANLEVIPNCVNLADYAGLKRNPQVNRLIFTGALSYRPNYDAMVWFLREVYGRIQAQVPDVQLAITGDPGGLPLPQASNVTLTGRVEDVRPLIASSWISLAPIFEGGGTRLKILEAMASSTPVVATSKGAEGLDVEAGRHLLIADTPSDFADAVCRVLKSPELRRSLADNASQIVTEKYDWSTVMPRFLSLIERVARADK